MDFEFQLRFQIPPEWSRIEPARQAVWHYVQAVAEDRDLSDALSIVASELLENAVKYSSGHREPIVLKLSGRDERRVTVEVSNRVDTEGEAIRTLEERLALVHSFENASDAYLATLTHAHFAAGSGTKRQLGGLGLARIAYEGGCTIEARVLEGWLTVTAHRETGA